MLSAAVSLTRVISKRASFQETLQELVTKYAATKLWNNKHLSFTTTVVGKSAQCPTVTGV
jgi:hypothetical protein